MPESASLLLCLVAPLGATRAGLRLMLAGAAGERLADWRIEEAATLGSAEQALIPFESDRRPSDDGAIDRPTVILLADGLDDRTRLERLASGRRLALVWLAEAGADPGQLAGLGLAGWAVLPSEAGARPLWAAVQAAAEGLVILGMADDDGLEARLRSDQDGRLPSLPDDREALSPREREVLDLLAQGLANKHIAYRLSISEHTVKFHVSAVLAKLGAASRAEAVRIGIQRGYVTL